MIDWVGIAKNSLWIIGLATILASLNWASWLAASRGTRLRATIATPSVQAWLNLGLTLFSAGLFFSARPALERVLWAVFVLCFIAQVLMALRTRRGVAVTAVLRPAVHPRRKRGVSFALLKKAAGWVTSMEPWLLLAATPFLMFPNRFTPALVALLALPWLARRLTQGHFTARTPMDWPILILLVMLPVSLWASVDVQRSMPKLYGIILGVAVFYGIVNGVRGEREAWIVAAGLALAGLGVSALALLGTNWASPQVQQYLSPLVSRAPASMHGRFNPNEVGAALCLFIPFVASLLFLGFPRSQGTGAVHLVMDVSSSRTAVETLQCNVSTAGAALQLPQEPSGAADHVTMPGGARRRVLSALLALALLVMVGTLILSQSRSAFVGIIVALLVLASFRRRWVWLVVTVALLVGALVALCLRPEQIQSLIVALYSDRNVTARFEIWQRALWMIQDFPYTGVGLNTYSLVANALYPFFSIAPERVLQLTHAHNAFLQVAVDLGIPGLVAYLSLLLGFGAAWRTAYRHFPAGRLRALSVGLLCGIVGYHVYGLTDCITLGAKPGVAIWAMLGLMAALANLSLGTSSRRSCAAKRDQTRRSFSITGDPAGGYVQGSEHAA